jgi:hypothetical protein
VIKIRVQQQREITYHKRTNMITNKINNPHDITNTNNPHDIINTNSKRYIVVLNETTQIIQCKKNDKSEQVVFHFK